MNQHLRNAPGNTDTKEDWLVQVDRLMAEGEFKGALAILNPRLRGGDLDIRTLDRASVSFFSLGDVKTAISLMKVMRDLRPEIAPIWGKLASMQVTAGETEAAISNQKKALELNPHLAAGLASLYRLEPFSADSPYADRLREITVMEQLPVKARSEAWNVLGAIERRANNPAEAMRCFARSKGLMNEQYKPGGIDQAVAIQAESYSPVQSADTPVDGPRMVFVCGLPRSGTTLTETILQRHSQVGTVGESKALSNTLNEAKKLFSVTGRQGEFWPWLLSRSPEEISVFRRHYLAGALRGDDKGTAVIDKMPMNCLHLGFAQVLLPGAKFVFMSRHPLDVGLSIFSLSFSESMPFGSRLDWLGHMTAAVYRSALDYQVKLGSQMRVQSYEALVREPETQIRALLAHCGLDWEEACLSPEENAGMVNTASQLQVREKINTKGLNKWKPFEAELQPLTEALGGPEWLAKWESWDRNAARSGQFGP